MDYLKVGRASDLNGRERKIYRGLEMLPGFLSLGTLLLLIILSYFKPAWVAYFIIAFNVYWLLLVIYLALHLLVAYKELKKNRIVNWEQKLKDLNNGKDVLVPDCLAAQGLKWEEVYHLLILPTYREGSEIIRTCLNSLINDGYPLDKFIVVLAIEGRAGQEFKDQADIIEAEFSKYFGHFLVTCHPADVVGELKGKGANQAYAARIVKEKIVDFENIPYDKILLSVFDIDTVVIPGYFSCLTYRFLTVSDPYHASYQPVPVYHNNIWGAPFFARVIASSNTFWQMMQQIRSEKLATYSSHSMTFKALVDIDFWATNMVSEDSRVFWHCFLYYNGNYRVEPLHFPVSMDVTMDVNFWETARSLYKQQRRWAWGSENVPYLIFNAAKRWSKIDRRKAWSHIFIQVYGFHSWATNALIIAVIGWMPIILGGDSFKSTVLSGNLPVITSALMNIAMIGLVLSAVVSTLLLPPRPANYGFRKKILMFVEWVFVPVAIVLFGAIPCLDAQIRLLFGKYMGFWVTPKSR